MNPKKNSTRRQFLQTTTAAAGATWLAGCATPPAARKGAASPNGKLNIAAIGVGGKGAGDIAQTSAGQNVVAICDVDDRTLNIAAKKYTKAAKYHDWRRMLERNDIDAVTVSTPDHMHCPIAMAAIQLGKHVYVQKPMSHTIQEARVVAAAAKKAGVVTQMGNQNHSGAGYKTLVQAVRSGVIGKVKEAHAWSNRPVWPQGIERPQGSDPVPDHLWWDLWLGVAPYRYFVGPQQGAKRGRGPYHSFNWRGFLDFGVGALGDMGCHIIDPVVWGLQLGAPTRVWSSGPATNGETFPNWETIHYEFPGTAYCAEDTIRMTWHDGGKKPSANLVQGAADKDIPANGVLFVGERGALLCPHKKMPQLWPRKDFANTKLLEVPGDNHYQQWTMACKGEGTTVSNFDYSGPMTETVLLGTIAVRYPNQKLEWDSEGMKFTNSDEANKFVKKSYRPGWQVVGLG
ncbi:MAG: dehydrogenase [Verrucomicrobiales bacterium]|nr:dehydrogenase [Verrucomicrobiales bacterium]|tara:strand:+ start:3067 stop:4437 length:1371 start_codon:yes stop_codon:yes gene_type:complete